MPQIECPKPAYDRLVKAGLDKKIAQSWRKIERISLSMFDIDYDYEKIERKLEEALKSEDLRKFHFYSDVLKLRDYDRGEWRIDKEEALIQNPALLAYLVLGTDILNPEKYRFPNRRKLEEAIASFCIGEKRGINNFMKDKYFWRNSKYKNEMTNGWHGDCWAFQTDVSGTDRREKTFFGEREVFDAWKDISSCREGFNADYGYWREFLMIQLRYAEAIGKARMPEITNWRDVLARVGAVGTATTEAMFGGGGGDWHLRDLAESGIFIEGKKKRYEKGFLSMLSGSIDKGTVYYPYVSDGKLLYLKESPDGEIELPFKKRNFAGKRFSLSLVYDEKDLPHLLEGTYSLFARDRSELPKIMNLFLSSAKS